MSGNPNSDDAGDEPNPSSRPQANGSPIRPQGKAKPNSPQVNQAQKNFQASFEDSRPLETELPLLVIGPENNWVSYEELAKTLIPSSFPRPVALSRTTVPCVH